MVSTILSFLSTLSHFSLDFFASFFNPLAPYLIERYGIEVKLLTSFLTLTSATASLSQIFFAAMFDRVSSSKKILFTIYIFEFIGISMLGLATNFWVALISIFLVRIANSSFHPLGAAMAGEHSGQSVAFFSIAGTIGSALGPIFISFFVLNFDLKYLWIATMPLLAISIWILRTKIPGRTVVKKEKVSLAETSVLLPILLVVTIRSFSMSIIHTYTPIYVTRVLGYPISISGALITSGTIAGVFANYLGIVLMKKIGAKRQDLIAFLGMAASIGFMMLSQNLTLLFIFYILFDFCGFLLMSANVVQAQSMLPHRKALASSVAMGLAWSIGDFAASAYNAIFGNNVLLSMGLIIPVTVFASIYFGVVQKFDTKV
ncbi:MAG TPA: MFS transporter [Fervidobacterium sp.]|nr:MFS transporter [Fervidobacterium sp.]